MEKLVTICITVPVGLKQRIKDAAKRENKSVSDFSRTHLEKKLNQQDAKPEPEQ